jgi:metal-sulfur cluster biosynthetic enzyme
MGMKKIISIKPDAPSSDGPKGVSFKKFDNKKPADQDIEITEEKVYQSLKTVYDPELPVNIVELGLIYDTQISGRDVKLKMTLTTPGCGMGAMIANQAEMAIKNIGARNVLIDIVWDPPWNPDMMTDEAKKRLGVS